MRAIPGNRSGARLRLAVNFVALVLFGVPTVVLAQSMDCSKIKSTTVPVELVVRFDRFEQAYQVYREAGKTAVLWTRQTTPHGINISKAETINGFGITSSLTSTVDKVPDQEAQHRYSGIVIEDDDRRHSVSYKVSWTFKYRNGTARQVEQGVDYTFVSAGETTIGSCALAVYRGEVKFTDVTSGRTDRMFHIYFPELRIGVTSLTPEPVFVSLSTSFEPLRMLR
ncbi:hypothetical protein [Bradyrhizobium sp. Rc2d]|uniref:hypothetical protein n=1 Tax=Bradyrhizobium sp. Rc2d TaxID=1855321 RepID=UPI000B8A55E0|nr:hypothetical protein [Bradyrhizobium sp. Rc2d]